MAEITVNELDELVRTVPEGTGVPRRIRAGDRLFLEVRRPGTEPARASWVLRYSHTPSESNKGGKHSLGLGKYYPQGVAGVGGVTLAQARKAAKLKLLEIDKGVQPVKAARATAKKQASEIADQKALEKRTVGEAVRLWHEATKGDLTSDKSDDQRLRRLSEYLPYIGDTPVASLTVSDVSGALTELKGGDKETGRKANRIETLHRSISDLEKAIDYAASMGWIADDAVNPVIRARKGVGKKPPQIGQRSFKADRLPEFSKALHGVDAVLPYPVTAHLLRMLTLTGARTKEMRELQWSEVEGLDGDKPMLHIPASRMKRRADWSVPLSPQAAKLLIEIRGWQGQVGAGLKGVKDGYVFTRLEGNYKGRVCSENAVNDLLKEMGWHGELVGHGLRKVFSTVGHASWPYLGANRTEAIEFSLAHVHKDKVRGTYDLNQYMDQRRALMVWWANHLDAVRQPQGAKVVKLRSGHR